MSQVNRTGGARAKGPRVEDESLDTLAQAAPAFTGDSALVEVIPGRASLLSGLNNEVRVVVRISTPQLDLPKESRAPVAVACVLDRSASMAKAKLSFAKRAIKKLVKHLLPTDELHLVSYASKSTVEFAKGSLDAEGKEKLNEQIDAIQARGSASQAGMLSGLESAALLLGQVLPREYIDPEDPSDSESERKPTKQAISLDGEDEPKPTVLRRIFLFGDGRMTPVATISSKIQHSVATWAQDGVQTATFGIGSNFDESLLREIALAGAGKYTLLPTAQDIPRLFSKSVHSLLNVFATEAVLKITTVRPNSPKIYCVSMGSLMQNGVLRLNDLHANNTRMVLLWCECAPNIATKEGTNLKICSWQLNYKRHDGVLAEISGDLNLRATSQRDELEAEAPTVRAMFAINRAAAMEMEVAELIGKRDKIMALEVKRRQMAVLQETVSVAEQAKDTTPVDLKALESVLRRAEKIHDRIQQEEEAEVLRRRCMQEMDLESAMSLAAFSSGDDSDNYEDDLGIYSPHIRAAAVRASYDQQAADGVEVDGQSDGSRSTVDMNDVVFNDDIRHRVRGLFPSRGITLPRMGQCVLQ